MRPWKRIEVPNHCAHCGAHVDHGCPETDEDWVQVAGQHLSDCEWVETRSHCLCPACGEWSGVCPFFEQCVWTEALVQRLERADPDGDRCSPIQPPDRNA